MKLYYLLIICLFVPLLMGLKIIRKNRADNRPRKLRREMDHEETNRQTVPLNKLIHIRQVKRDSIESGPYIYSFIYPKGRKKIHASFFVSGREDSLASYIEDTFVVLRRNCGYELFRPNDTGRGMVLSGCGLVNGMLIGGDSSLGKKDIYLNFHQEAKHPVLRLSDLSDTVLPKPIKIKELEDIFGK